MHTLIRSVIHYGPLLLFPTAIGIISYLSLQHLLLNDFSSNAVQFGNKIFWFSISIALLSFVFKILYHWLLIRRLHYPLKRIRRRVEQLADGHLIQPIGQNIHSQQHGQDISRIARRLETMRQSFYHMTENIRLNSNTIAAGVEELILAKDALKKDATESLSFVREVVEDHKEVSQGATDIQKAAHETAHGITAMSASAAQLFSNIQTIASTSCQVSNSIQDMAQVSSQIDESLTGVNSNLVQVNQSVTTVSTSINEMQNALNGVRTRCIEAGEISTAANQMVQEAGTVMSKLDGATNKIGNVTEVINSIAEQTNMLALNASIEAAGAGEAGKGFSVVANEVKDLARQTAEATQMISEHIGEIQSISRDVVDSNQEIVKKIGSVYDANNEIVHAMDEQQQEIHAISSAIDNISQSSEEVSATSQDLNQTVSTMATAAQEAATGASNISQSAGEAAQAAETLSTTNEKINQMALSVSTAAKQSAVATEHANEKILKVDHNTVILHGAINNMARLIDTITHPEQQLKKSILEFDLGGAPMDIKGIKGAHLKWLGRLENVIRGRSELTPDQVASDRECDFGRWYYGEGNKQFGDATYYKEVGMTHANVHNLAREIVDLVSQGHVAQAEDKMKQFNQLKDELFEVLDKLYRHIISTTSHKEHMFRLVDRLYDQAIKQKTSVSV
ncbi:methyl-accepting chemotaxis protein [Magnetococcales bacterium HHB-1]